MSLNSAVSQEWFDELSWLFAYWHQFRKAKNYFSIHLVGMVKHGYGLLGDGPLTSAVSQEWVYELAEFLHAGTHSGSVRIIVWISVRTKYT